MAEIAPDQLYDLLKTGGVASILGFMVYIFLKFFMQQLSSREQRDNAQSDEDRKWIREVGSNQMLLMSQMFDYMKRRDEQIEQYLKGKQ